jgi:ribose 5-phosphate isomerase A
VPGLCVLRQTADGHPFVTDGGHLILDASLKRIADPVSLANRLCIIPGVVEHGLFINLANIAILAGSQGIRVIERED